MASDSRLARRHATLADVQREIRRAQAEALGRVGERLATVLADLAALDHALDVTAPPADEAARQELAARVTARDRRRDQAAGLQRDLIIQREALGLTRHASVAERYPLPGRRHRRLAPLPEDPA